MNEQSENQHEARPQRPMRFAELRWLIRSDLWRHFGRARFRSFLFAYWLFPGFRYTVWLRICTYLRQHGCFRGFIYPLARLNLQRYKVKYGIDIVDAAQVGSGLYIGHFGGIFVNGDAVIGKNCNLSPGVVLAFAARGKRKGFPTVGDNVYIGPGAKIIGNVKIGNHVCIGGNCVVTQDVLDHAVVAGVPGRIISYAGSKIYVDRTDY